MAASLVPAGQRRQAVRYLGRGRGGMPAIAPAATGRSAPAPASVPPRSPPRSPPRGEIAKSAASSLGGVVEVPAIAVGSGQARHELAGVRGYRRRAPQQAGKRLARPARALAAQPAAQGEHQGDVGGDAQHAQGRGVVDGGEVGRVIVGTGHRAPCRRWTNGRGAHDAGACEAFRRGPRQSPRG
jgi:hypothetical protein